MTTIGRLESLGNEPHRKGTDMPRIAYISKRFSPASVEIIHQANIIIDEYSEMGYDLTLRQLYYQFVARDLLPNSMRSYKRLGSIVNDARLAGLIDWDAIQDRTRNVQTNAHWDSPAEIVQACADQFRTDMWKNQDYHVEVWIEKDALIGVISNICKKMDLPHFSCRGYTSQSEMWRAAQRLAAASDRGQTPVILHLGDHDPSGIDMSRDIRDRVELLGCHNLTFKRLALNIEQVRQYDPPPNPAKLTDTRAADYVLEFGSSSWELDALAPNVIEELISDAVDEYVDAERWAESQDEQQRGRDQLRQIADRWDDIMEFVED